MEQLRQAIHEIEHNWASSRILVVGDVMLDKYVFGDVARISPEAPVPVVRATHSSEQPGGAANVAMNVARLGAQAHVIGFTGGDESQRLLTARLDAEAIKSNFVICDGFPTITKQRILGGRQQIVRVDTERIGARPTADHDRLIAVVLEHLPSAHAVVLSDYAKGVLTPEVCSRIIEAARGLGIPVLVDPKATDFARYRGATAICPNLGELAAATGEPSLDLLGVLDAGRALIAPLKIEFLVATLSDKGIALLQPEGHFIAPAVARQVFDVSGAGDTVIATLALSLASGLNPLTAVELANLAAGIVVAKVGTVPVEKHELLAALAPDLALHAEEKVLTREELVTRVARWRAGGQRVVFTNGCFDLLHVGHITLLEQAHRFGDRLIVAINSDASVSALKGPTRPIVGQRERARVLAALAAVDAVVVFDDATPLELIAATRPDVLVKGGDYVVATVVGAAEVESWGGQVKIVPIVAGYSTTRLIDRGAGK
jgi:D-beta-D-heptose 7-phosphate kinase/D-beta-D-heptose 1-phosphate adenosyltransferase